MKQLVVGIILWYLRLFAHIALKLHKPTIIGITGSVGKTSTRDLVYALLKEYYVVKVIKKGNSETGIPLGILGLEVQSLGFSSGLIGMLDWTRLIISVPLSIFHLQKTDYLIIEMGIDEPTPPKNMDYLLSIVRPHISIILNAKAVHTMQFEKAVKGKPTYAKVVDIIAREKSKLATHNPNCQIVIFNNDDVDIKKYVETASVFLKQTFGKNQSDDISYKDYSVTFKGSSFAYTSKVSRNVLINIEDYVLPKVYREVIAAGILLGEQLEIPIKHIKKAIEKNFLLPPGRSTLFEGINESVIIDSSYNASTLPTLALLDTAYKLKTTYKRKLVFAFGDMRELGSLEKEEHEKVAKEILKGVDELYCVGPLTKKFVIPYVENHQNSEFRNQKIKWFENSDKLGKYLRKNLSRRSIILVKGSQNTIYLEEGIKHILKNKDDISKLCRQTTYWLRMKKTIL